METRIVLIGAGSAQFGFGTLGDIFKSQLLQGSHVVLHDINPQTLKRVRQVGQAYLDEHKLSFTLSATTDRKKALRGANFCIISIEVGDRFELWEQDWRIPQQYGIRQVYGENGGPGGLFHSLRIIPPILDICGDIMALCPQAHVFNFSNPMSRICTTVHRKYPDLKLVGLCHEIASMPRHLPPMLDTPFTNLVIKAGGLNHFSILLECTYRDSGRDAYPDIRAKAPAYFASLPSLRETAEQWQREQETALEGEKAARDETAGKQVVNERHPWPERGLFEQLLNRFGYLPITTDSHIGEYIQWAYDAVDHEGILDFYRFYKMWTQMKKPEMGKIETGERVIPMIEGILTDSGQQEEAANLPNAGYIDDLPSWLVVEVPATVDRNGLHGTPLGQFPAGFLGLLQNQVAVHNLTAEAVLTGSRQAVLQALLVDPIVDNVRNLDQMLDMMLEMQKPYLSYIH